MRNRIAGLVLLLAASCVSAADLVIGLGADVTSVDPHVLNAAPNNSIAEHVHYANPKMDSLLEQALATMDNSKRQKLLQEAVQIAIRDQAVVPLHYQVNTWAARRGYTYPPRTDERTHAFDVKKQ